MIFRSDRKNSGIPPFGGKRSCLMTTETINDTQIHVPLCAFEFTDNEVKSRYASIWKFWTSRYLLLQTEDTTHSERVLGKMTQGIRSDATRTKITQTETNILSERRHCSSESQLQSKSLAHCLHHQDISR